MELWCHLHKYLICVYPTWAWWNNMICIHNIELLINTFCIHISHSYFRFLMNRLYLFSDLACSHRMASANFNQTSAWAKSQVTRSAYSCDCTLTAGLECKLHWVSMPDSIMQNNQMAKPTNIRNNECLAAEHINAGCVLICRYKTSHNTWLLSH